MSIKRKFLFAISAVIALLALIIAAGTIYTTSEGVNKEVAQQKQKTADRLINILASIGGWSSTNNAKYQLAT